MIPFITLAVALLGITMLLYLKQWELRRNRILFKTVRARADWWVERGIHSLQENVPRRSKEITKKIMTHTAYHTSTALLNGVRFTEKHLAQFSNMVKGHKEIQDRGSASTYLQDVSAHKQQINGKQPE